MKRQISECDLCGDSIIPYNPKGEGMIFNNGNQVWPTPQGEIDVCQRCCKMLRKAKQFEIVTLHLDEVYLKAGFVRKDGFWTNDRN